MKRIVVTFLTTLLLASAAHAAALAEYQTEYRALQEAVENMSDTQTANANLLKSSSDANAIRESREDYMAAMQLYSQLSKAFSQKYALETDKPVEIQAQDAQQEATIKANKKEQDDYLQRAEEGRREDARKLDEQTIAVNRQLQKERDDAHAELERQQQIAEKAQALLKNYVIDYTDPVNGHGAVGVAAPDEATAKRDFLARCQPASPGIRVNKVLLSH
jgi:hypothetical protein